MEKLQSALTPALAVLLTAGAGVSVYAQQPVRIDSAVVSTYGLYESSISAFGTSLPDAVLRSPGATVERMLRLIPAIDVREREGMGVQADIGIRGGSADQTALLLNGVDFTDIRTGHQTHSLPVDADILSGLRLLDGGNMGLCGAIDMMVRPLSDQYLRANVSGGSHGYFYANLSGATTVERRGRLQIFEAMSLRRSDGYRRSTDFSNCNLYASVRYDHPEAGSFDMQAGRQDRSFGANGFYSLRYPDQYERTGTTLGSLRWNKVAGSWILETYLSYRHNSDRFELIRGSEEKVPFNYHLTDTWGAYASVSKVWVAGRTSVSGHWHRGELVSTVLGDALGKPMRIEGTSGRFYDKGKGRSWGNVQLRHQKRWDRVIVKGAVEGDFSSYGFTPLWNAGAEWMPDAGLRVSLIAARTMRLPTFTELYYTAAGYVSDPGLQPERATTVKASAEWARGKWTLGWDVYRRHGEDIIDWVRGSADADWESRQATTMDTMGANVSASWTPDAGILDGLSLLGGWTDSDKSAHGLISKYAMDYMHFKASLIADFSIGRRTALNTSLSYYDRNGNYSDADGDIVAYKPYALVNARLTYKAGVSEWHVDADNIFSASYFDYGGLEMPGIWLTGGMTITL